MHMLDIPRSSREPRLRETMVELLDFTPELRHAVEQELELILADFDHWELIRPQIEISIPWNLRVSPRNASIRAIALATLDIALWVFTLDDYTEDDDEQFFSECLGVLHGARPSPRRPILRAFAVHRDCMLAFGQPMDRYEQSRQNIADAYIRRNHLARTKHVIRFEEYLTWRRTLIGTRVWLSAWEVLRGTWLPDSVHDGETLHETLEALIFGQILENEIHSLPRDLAAGTPSLVLMHATEHALSIEDSRAILHDRFRANEAILRARITTATSEFRSDPSVLAFLEMVELCLVGSAALYELDLARYDVPPTT